MRFIHDQAQWKMRFSSDYDKVTRLNRQLDSDEVWTYWPEMCLYHIDHDVVESITKDIQKWDKLDQMNDKAKEWAIGSTRVFGNCPTVPYAQKVYAHMQFLNSFCMDDPYENSCRKGTALTFGSAFLSNCRAILVNDCKSLIDLKGFESEKTTKKDIAAALFGQEVLRDTTTFARDHVSRQVYEIHRLNNLCWIDAVLREGHSFAKNEALNLKTTYEEQMDHRIETAGFELVLAGILPPKDAKLHMYRNYNPFLHQGSMIVALDNDTASAPKERTEVDRSLSNLLFNLVEGRSEMEAVRELLSRRNLIARNMEQQMKILPKSWRPLYQSIFNYALTLCDYEYVHGKGDRYNPRYGFTWESC